MPKIKKKNSHYLNIRYRCFAPRKIFKKKLSKCSSLLMPIGITLAAKLTEMNVKFVPEARICNKCRSYIYKLNKNFHDPAEDPLKEESESNSTREEKSKEASEELLEEDETTEESE